MRYYGGGIGHLNNSLPQQADPPNSNSGKAAMPENAEENIEEDAERDGVAQDVIMHDEESEVAQNDDADGDDEDSTDPENYDYSKYSDEDGDEDEDSEGSTCSIDEEDSSGYASP